MRVAAARTICSCNELSSRYGTARSSGRSSQSPQPIARATRIQGPHQAGCLASDVAGTGPGATGADPGVSCSTMVTAHHDAESPDGCLIALLDGCSCTPSAVAVSDPAQRGGAC